jgi:hypothetical protein
MALGLMGILARVRLAGGHDVSHRKEDGRGGETGATVMPVLRIGR